MSKALPQKWKLLESRDVSPSKWFPIEERTYQLPNGNVVEDFTVTTLADVAMIVAITPDKKVVAIRQFKPGAGEVILEFPAGRQEGSHTSIEETAVHELEEETGIIVATKDLQFLGVTAPFVTKATERVYCYLVTDVVFSGKQKLDELEDILVEVFDFDEFEKELYNQIPITSVTLVAWELAKRKFPEIFLKK